MYFWSMLLEIEEGLGALFFNAGALIVRIGLGGYCTVIIIRNPQSNGPYIH